MRTRSFLFLAFLALVALSFVGSVQAADDGQAAVPTVVSGDWEVSEADLIAELNGEVATNAAFGCSGRRQCTTNLDCFTRTACGKTGGLCRNFSGTTCGGYCACY